MKNMSKKSCKEKYQATTDTHNHEEESQRFFIKMAEHNFELPANNNAEPRLVDMALCLTACKWGSGECGHTILEHLLSTFSESALLPKYVILLDTAVYLATENNIVNSLISLQNMEKCGTKILLNQTSVHHYQQSSFIKVGEITNFLKITEILMSVEKFVNI
jgi:hypothetical protein